MEQREEEVMCLKPSREIIHALTAWPLHHPYFVILQKKKAMGLWKYTDAKIEASLAAGVKLREKCKEYMDALSGSDDESLEDQSSTPTTVQERWHLYNQPTTDSFLKMFGVASTMVDDNAPRDDGPGSSSGPGFSHSTAINPSVIPLLPDDEGRSDVCSDNENGGMEDLDVCANHDTAQARRNSYPRALQQVGHHVVSVVEFSPTDEKGSADVGDNINGADVLTLGVVLPTQADKTWEDNLTGNGGESVKSKRLFVQTNALTPEMSK